MKTPPTVEDLKKSLQVKGHYRTVGGKQVWVNQHSRHGEQAAPKPAQGQQRGLSEMTDEELQQHEQAVRKLYSSPRQIGFHDHGGELERIADEKGMRSGFPKRGSHPNHDENSRDYQRRNWSVLPGDPPEPKGGRRAEQEAPDVAEGEDNIIRAYWDNGNEVPPPDERPAMSSVRATGWSYDDDYSAEANAYRDGENGTVYTLYARQPGEWTVRHEGAPVASGKVEGGMAEAKKAATAALRAYAKGGSGSLRKSVAEGVADLVATIQGYWRNRGGERELVPTGAALTRREHAVDPLLKSVSAESVKQALLSDDE